MQNVSILQSCMLPSSWSGTMKYLCKPLTMIDFLLVGNNKLIISR